jgi:hypothetical protein
VLALRPNLPQKVQKVQRLQEILKLDFSQSSFPHSPDAEICEGFRIRQAEGTRSSKIIGANKEHPTLKYSISHVEYGYLRTEMCKDLLL